MPFAEARFGLSGPVLGLSLTAFGLFHAATQAFVVGPLVAWKGQRAGLIVAMLADGAAYVAMALIGQGWMAFALMPLFALGGAANPILQALLSEAAGEGDQGRLMGTVTSLTSFVSIFAPMAITLIYAASATALPRLVWILAAACYPLCLPFLGR